MSVAPTRALSLAFSATSLHRGLRQSELRSAQLLCQGNGDSMYTRKLLHHRQGRLDAAVLVTSVTRKNVM
jgi:hypothetical protein